MQVHTQFEKILTFAHSNYDKRKISFRQPQENPVDIQKKRERDKAASERLHQKYASAKRKAKKIVRVQNEEICPQCGYKSPQQTESLSTRVIVDLTLTRSGVRKTMTKYLGFRNHCPRCNKDYLPSGISRYGSRQLYDHGLMAWIVYHRVALRLPYVSIVESLEEQFGEKITAGHVPYFMCKIAGNYAETEMKIAQNLLDSPVIHADETKFNIKGANWYVWVFANEKYVIFRLTETREATIVHEFLADYHGVLVSDFYPGYDSVECKQQKCWVHLIRDVNSDLQTNPFDTEFEVFVSELRDLIIPIMEAIQKYGLKRRNLNKFRKQVDRFFRKTITGRQYRSELTQKYQTRFLRYSDSLFTFLERDGIPWHNNTAERAIRYVAIQRDMSSHFSKSAASDYLLLLGIRQTCLFQGKSFFKLLFSEEKDIDKFK